MKPQRRAVSTTVTTILTALVVVGFAAAFGYLAYASSPKPVPVASTTTTDAITTSTLPCSAPGVQCGSLNVSSISLTAALAPQNSTLTATVKNTGNIDIWQVMFYVNGSLIDTSQGIAVGNTSTYIVPIPPSVSVVSGQSYKIDVDSTILLSGGRTDGGGADEIFVTAS